MVFFRKFVSEFVALILLAICCPPMVTGQERMSTIGGRVFSGTREAVGGVKIFAKDSSGKTFREAVSDEEGLYCLENLARGQYQLTLESSGSNFQNHTVIASLGLHELTVDWFISTNAKAIAVASVGQSVCLPLTAGGKAAVGGIFGSGWLGALIAPFVTSPSR